MWESRVVLTPTRPQALAALLDQTARRGGLQLGHRLIWTLFADEPDRSRDFLYLVERERPFTAIVRSARAPVDGIGGLWTIERSYRFEPRLEPGQRLRFRLKAVPVTWTRTTARAETKRQDVIMAAWRRLTDAERADPERLEASAESAARAWLQRQGERCGFEVSSADLAVLDYDRRRVPTGRPGQRLIFGAVTFEGLLEVREVDEFRQTLGLGLGALRAFGHGLLQVAPWPSRDRPVL
jgi:CRISPR system Cascade subunit CasE